MRRNVARPWAQVYSVQAQSNAARSPPPPPPPKCFGGQRIAYAEPAMQAALKAARCAAGTTPTAHVALSQASVATVAPAACRKVKLLPYASEVPAACAWYASLMGCMSRSPNAASAGPDETTGVATRVLRMGRDRGRTTPTAMRETAAPPGAQSETWPTRTERCNAIAARSTTMACPCLVPELHHNHESVDDQDKGGAEGKGAVGRHRQPNQGERVVRSHVSKVPH